MRPGECGQVSTKLGVAVIKIARLRKNIIEQRNSSKLCVLIAATLAPLLAMGEGAFANDVAAPRYKMTVLNRYQTNGRNDGCAIQAADGLIWNGTIDGVMRRLDPAQNNRVSMEWQLSKYSPCGVTRGSLSKMDVDGQELIVVGHGRGINCYSTDGTQHHCIEDLDASILTPVIPWQKQKLICIGGDGLTRILDIKDWKFDQTNAKAVLPGVTCSNASLLNVPCPTVIYGTKRFRDIVTKELEFRISLTPLVGRDAFLPIAYTLRPEEGQISLTPTVVKTNGFEHAYLVTTKAKVLKIGPSSPILEVAYALLLDLKAEPFTPVINSSGFLHVFAYDTRDGIYQKISFTPDGLIVSRSTVFDANNKPVTVRPTSTPTVFNTNGSSGTVMLQGFSDSALRFIDVDTASVVDSMKTERPVVQPPAQLTDFSFFVTEEPGPMPNELTLQYLIRIAPLSDLR